MVRDAQVTRSRATAGRSGFSLPIIWYTPHRLSVSMYSYARVPNRSSYAARLRSIRDTRSNCWELGAVPSLAGTDIRRGRTRRQAGLGDQVEHQLVQSGARQALIQSRLHLLVIERVTVDLVDTANDLRRGSVSPTSVSTRAERPDVTATGS